MLPVSNSKAATYALLIGETLGSFQKDKINLTPVPVDEINNNWNIIGYLKADDNNGTEKKEKDSRFYAYFLQSKKDPKEFVISFRGTSTPTEYENDRHWEASKSLGNPGHVVKGFGDIFNSMELTVGNKTFNHSEMFNEVANIVNKENGNVTTIGNSLGAALSTYTTLELSKEKSLQDNLRMCNLASPKVGDTEFIENFDKKVSNYTVINYVNDIIPTLPLKPFGTIGFHQLKKEQELNQENSQAIVKNEIWRNHHVTCYAAMLDYNLCSDWKVELGKNNYEIDSIVGKNNHLSQGFFEKLVKGSTISRIHEIRMASMSMIEKDLKSIPSKFKSS